MSQNRKCPKCGCVNPNTEERVLCWNIVTKCKNIISTKKILFWNKNIYCDSINEIDLDDDWIYLDNNK